MYIAENTLKPLSPVSIMSSTSNVQNLLSNVFRPTFVYAAGTGYQSRLEMTNIDTVSANTVKTYTASVGDPSNNVYVGTGSGNAYATLGASSNISNTFLGVSAGGATSNVKNSVFLGYRSGYGASNSSNSISIGANTLNGGNSNVYIGCGTGITTGSNNIFIGPGLSQASVSNTMLVGSGTNILLNGDLVNKRVGINLSTLPTFDPSVPILLDVNGYARVGVTSNNGKLGVNIPPAYSLDVNGNMRVSDGYGTLIMSNDVNSNSVTTLRTSGTYPTALSTLGVANGYYSSQGTMLSITGYRTVASNILPGSIMFSAESPDGSLYHYAQIYRRRGTYDIVSQTSNALLLSATLAGGLALYPSASNLNWNVAYFPSTLVVPTLTLSPSVVTTLAGDGFYFYVEGTGSGARFQGTGGLYVLPDSNILVGTTSRIRLVTPGGVTSTVVGNGTSGTTDGTGASATVYFPYAFDMLPDGKIIMGDSNHLRVLTYPGMVVTTLIGGASAFADGDAATARFGNINGLAVLRDGNIAVADNTNRRIRIVTYPGGNVSTLAGNGTAGVLPYAYDVAQLPDGDLIVSDFGNSRIRRITYPGGVISTFVTIPTPHSFAVLPTGMILATCYDIYGVRAITNPGGATTVLAGNGSMARVDGTGTAAGFKNPTRIAVNRFTGVAYVSDVETIRQMTLPYS